MTLSPGTRFGSYEIVAALGAGGMGEVYRARDTRLDRQVAIKVLPPSVADDHDRRTRFEREARALASLNHPNVAQIYGVHESDGTTAILMELVEGEDLAALIARGPLTWAHARPLARQIAEALDAAHERGIVHRDLKPANIRITPDGTVKVLDFGLAKAIDAEGLSQDAAHSPTITAVATRAGIIVGTAAYMAPEQAKGTRVDKRADIWAFGVVLYEMLTGRSPFGAESVAESLGLVVTGEPDWNALPSSTPVHIVDLLKRCLVKDPKGRLRDIGDALHGLQQPDVAVAGTGAAPATSGRRAVLIGLAAAVLFAALAATAAWMLKPSVDLPFRRLDLPDAIASAKDFALSPNGRLLAYLQNGRLFVRDFSEAEPRQIALVHPTTEFLFWSPDSQTVGFYGERKVSTVPAAGGPVFTVCAVPVSGDLAAAPAWGRDGRILMPVWRDSLYAVRATGGAPEIALSVDPKTEIDFHRISLLPDGRILAGVHLRDPGNVRFELIDLSSKRREVLTDDSTVRDFHYAAPGHLLFRRVGTNAGLWALPFADLPVDLSRAVFIAPAATAFSASDDRTLVMKSETAPTSTLAWLTPDGKTTTQIPGPAISNLFPWIAVSPDGSQAAHIAGLTPAAVMVRDLATGTDSRVTSESVKDANAILGSFSSTRNPAWFPSGDRVLYARGQIEGTQLVAMRADGSGDPLPINSGVFGRASRDGKWLLWLEDIRGENRLRYAAFNGTTITGEVLTPLGLDRVDVRWFDLSNDGTLLAYHVAEQGTQSNVHLAAFPAGTPRRQVTSTGGTYPRFSPDGKKLYYLSGVRDESGGTQGRLNVVPITSQATLAIGLPTMLVSGAALPIGYDVARDGRLLIVRSAGERPRAMLLENWPRLTGNTTK